jgi:DHA1 family bicyclomycin/chloramphenicol resistance-like MFS transporter
MRIDPASFSFTLLLGLLSVLPPFGIDMILPALPATGASLGVPPSDIGLAMSVYLLSLGVAPLVYGPVSDRYGRKRVMMFGCALLIIASIGCATAGSLPVLLAWRVAQGAGAASAMLVMAVIRDLFDGRALHARISYVVIAMNVVPLLAPTLGAELLAVGNWRVIYLALAAGGLVLLLVMAFGFGESARIDPNRRLTLSAAMGDYVRVILHPVCRGYILAYAAATGAVFAYVAGSSLFFIDVVGLRPDQYGLLFGATALAVMAGAFLDGRSAVWGVSSGHVLRLGLGLLMLSAFLLLGLTVAGWTPLPLMALFMFGATFAFGLIAPNVTSGAMQPMPQMAGVVGAAAGFFQMMAAAASSGLVAALFDGHSARSMSATMAFFALLAAGLYLGLVRPGERVVMDLGGKQHLRRS